MAGSSDALSAKAALGYKSANKDRRKQFHVNQKKARDSIKRKERFERKREEAKNPELRKERLAKNKPHTIDGKRKWDEAVEEDGELRLGMAVDLEAFSKRRRLSEIRDEAEIKKKAILEKERRKEEGHDSDVDSMLEDSDAEDSDDPWGSDEDEEADDSSKEAIAKKSKKEATAQDEDSEADEGSDQDSDASSREQSPTASIAPSLAPSMPMSTTSTRLDLTPESLLAKFPTIFNPPSEPKVLITTSLNSTLHKQAQLLTTLFPNSHYVRRSAHRFGHKFSVREISAFAANRNFTTLMILMEDQKKPCGLDVVHLPHGPMFHFSLTNWIEGKKLPGHGNPTGHDPELILHNFKTPLGMLSAALFQGMFPANPELQGRQVVTLHNQRDYIFVRRHRYVFRDKRATEKSVQDADGLPMKGAEDIRAGLQELGPRFTLKLRRVDKAIQRASGQEWEWKGRTDKDRTKFQL